METLKLAKELNIRNKTFHLMSCDYCSEKLIVGDDDIEYDSMDMKFKCCNCGHIQKVNKDEYNNNLCEFDGKII